MNLNIAKKWVESVKNTVLSKLAAGYIGRIYDRYRLCVSIGNDGSYTDLYTSIVVNVRMEEVAEHTPADLMRILKFLLYHECSHVLYTNPHMADKCTGGMVDILSQAAGRKGVTNFRRYAEYYSHNMLNCLEDGRIENILVSKKPGVKKHRDWYRIINWEKEPHQKENPLSVTYLNLILDIATMGVYPKYFLDDFKDNKELLEKAEMLAPIIGGFVASDTLDDAKIYSDQIMSLIADDIIVEMQGKDADKPALEDLKKQIENAEKNFKGESGEEHPNGPVIGILTDEDTDKTDEGENLKPDIIIDLRTKKDKVKEDDERENGEDTSGESGENRSNSAEKEEKKKAGTNTPSGTENAENGELASSDAKSEDGLEAGSEDEPKGESEDSSSVIESEKGDNSESSDESSDESGDESGDKAGGEAADEAGKKDTEDAKKSGETGKKIGSTPEAGDDSDDEVDVSSSQMLQDLAEELANSMSRIKEKLEEESEFEISSDLTEARKGMELSDLEEKSSISRKDMEDCMEQVPAESFIENKTCGRCTNSLDPEIKRRASITRSKLQNILKAKEAESRTELYSGMLDVNSLGLFCTGRTDVFKEEAIPDNDEICCYILKDHSGSMNSNFKESLAIEALAEVEETLRGVMPVKITAFHGDYDVKHEVIKDWNDADPNISYSLRFGSNMPNDGNNDGFSISVATKELLKRPEEHRILIVISDGKPTGCTEADVQKVVRFARKNGIFVINFLIGDKDFIAKSWEKFRNMYGTYFGGVNPELLGNSLFSFIRKYVENF